MRTPSRHITEISRVKLTGVDGLPVRVADIEKALIGKAFPFLLVAIVTAKDFVLDRDWIPA